MFIQAVEGIYIYLQCVLVQSGYISIFIYPTHCQILLRVSYFSSLHVVDSDESDDDIEVTV